MAIYDKDGNLLSYARRSLPKNELGGTGRSYAQRFQQYLGTDEYLSNLQFPYDVPIYEKMARSDGQVKAMLLMLSLPIRSTEWFIKPKDDSAEAKKIASFVEDCLFGGYGTGLSNGFDDFIKDVTTMFQFGHSIFEKVFEVKNGKYKWKKFAVRPQSTIYDIYYDNVGDVKGIEQYMIHNNWDKVYIPIEKLLIYSHDMQQGNVRGTSVLRAAYKHWTIKDFLYKIVNVGVERNFIGTPVLTLPEGYTQEDKELADEIVTTLRSSEFGGVRLPDGFILDMFEGKRTLTDVLPYIEHQDKLMSKSVVAGFMDLGSNGGTGSFALSSDQSQMFLMMLDSSAKNICNTTNTHAIPEIVRYNFDSDLIPTLGFKPMNSTKVINTLKTLVDGKIVLPDDDLEGYIRSMLDLPDANPIQSRKEAIDQFQQNQIASIESKSNNNQTDKSKTPIASNSKQSSYKNKIKDDNVNKKMSEPIDYVNLPEVVLHKLENIIKRQLISLKEKAEKESIDNLSKLSISHKGEVTKLIQEIFKNNLGINETDLKFKAKTNVISNNVSERVKSMFLAEFIECSNINIDALSKIIIENI